jgi:hypothetical protein
VACGIISDIAAALQMESEQYLSSLVPHLLTVLGSPKRERRTKLIAFQSLADVAFYAGPCFCKNYLQDTLIILRSACMLSIKTTEFLNDPDALEYLQQLQVCLLEAYTPITQGVKDANTQMIYQ